jgi:SAM-dependent methyltransferase
VNGDKIDNTAVFKNPWLELLLVSLLSIFCELVIIRWLSTEIRVFQYFKNLPLMSAFLGLGLGFLWVDHKRNYFRWSSLLFLLFSGLLILAFPFQLTFLTFANAFDYVMFGVNPVKAGSEAQMLFESLKNLLIMLGIFFFSASIFVGLGQKTALLFQKMKPLSAYSVNVLGGLLGTLLFALLSFWCTGPAIWMLVAGLLYLVLDRRPASMALCLVAILYATVLAPHIVAMRCSPDYLKTIWSPYYRVDVITGRVPPGLECAGQVWGYDLQVNYDVFQDLFDCSPENLAKFPPRVQKSMKEYFGRSYALFKDKPPERVLILGSGNGSDVAAAIRAGASYIDAVEIDPAILQLGKELHNEKPYSNPKVHVHIMDARTFLETAKEKYDLILFATLDSHAAFSCMSSLRMDNYVFTQEALEEASKLLTDRGLICLEFVWNKDWLWDKHAKALTQATGMLPFAFVFLGTGVNNGYEDYKTARFFAGPLLKGQTSVTFNDGVPLKQVTLNPNIEVSTDDVPFLYMPKRELPLIYMLPVSLVILLSGFLVASQLKQGFLSVANWQMFFLGAAFMLLEVRSMASLSLLFGSTWVVNVVTIAGVMLLILLANQIALRLNSSAMYWLVPLLLASIITGSFISAARLATMGSMAGQAAGAVLYLAPMGLAAILFALLFRQSQNPPIALAFNLIGGLIGVYTEYLSMWLGISALGWIVSATYLLVVLLPLIKKPGQLASPS